MTQKEVFSTKSEIYIKVKSICKIVSQNNPYFFSWNFTFQRKFRWGHDSNYLLVENILTFIIYIEKSLFPNFQHYLTLTLSKVVLKSLLKLLSSSSWLWANRSYWVRMSLASLTERNIYHQVIIWSFSTMSCSALTGHPLWVNCLSKT